MTTDELCDASIRSLAGALRSGRVSPLELLDAYLGRISRAQDLNAFITVTVESARREARRAERRLRAKDEDPLLGVPLAIKDIFAVKGVRTTAGSRILRDWVPSRDAIAVLRLRKAGAVLLGKTNMHEFAYGVSNANPWWGIARNPKDRSRSPGGSSGGSAIAVAAGLCAGALGTDTGGSIRIPAALCGCVGLKPTYGSIPLQGVIPLGWSLDHAGPLARSVDDAGLLFEVLSGRPMGPMPRVRGLRVGIMRGSIFERVQPAVLSAVDLGVEALRRAGMRTRELKLPEMAWTIATQLVTLRSEASTFHARWLRARPRSYGRDVLARLQLGALIPAADYVLAQQARDRIREAVRQAFMEVDLLAMPTAPLTAPLVGARTLRWHGQTEPVDGALVRLTAPFNLTGLPAISVPCGSGSPLPVGLQLVAPWGQEARLIAAGRVVEV